MNKFVVLALLCLTSTFAEVALLGLNSETAIAGQYIVVFHEHISSDKHERYVNNLRGLLGDDENNQILGTFSINSFKGFSARFDKKWLAVHQALDEMVNYIEADSTVHAYQACTVQSQATWGLDRLNHYDVADMDQTFVNPYDGASNVDAYIVDTGIRTDHTDFGGRARWGVNYADTTNSDCNGHGTHVAGTVGGKTWGVAKKVTLIAVKVLDCAGSGTNTGVISGIDWVASQAQSSRRPSVANMSLGGGFSRALNNAVAAAVASGVTFVVAAGNEDQDACNTSPASEASAISVGATTISDDAAGEFDQRASFSNFGTCVDVFAPGQLITSAWYTSTTATKTISGTSMASPHVCGVAALFVSENTNATPAQVRSGINNGASSNLIDLSCGGDTTCTRSPNLLLFQDCN